MNNKTTAIPEWTKYRRVDTVIETMSISRETERELLVLMPNAYEGELPGEDSWPEPDALRDEPYKLSIIWDKLSDVAKADLIKVYDDFNAEYFAWLKETER